MRKPKSPCLGCPERNVGCHSRCKDYKKFQKNQDEYNKELHKEDWFKEYTNEQIYKQEMKNKHRRKPSYGNKNSNN